MRNTLTDLNNYLFEELERLTDDSLTDKELQKEINRSRAVSNVATAIVSNGKLALQTVKYIDTSGIADNKEELAKLPPMLEGRNG